MRLDRYLVEHSFVDSRNIAKELIAKQLVVVNGSKSVKASTNIEDNSLIEILQDKIYVSRASYKLKGFLEYLDIDLSGLHCLDIGSSRGGFVEVLLENSVKSIVCVDVGSNQLHSKLRDNKRVIFFENQDIRDFDHSSRFDLVTCDVSFISILNIIESIDKFAMNKIILLFKPQFEVGKDVKRDKKGVVLDKKSIELAKNRVIEMALLLGWKLIDREISRVSGKEGNIEELFYFQK